MNSPKDQDPPIVLTELGIRSPSVDSTKDANSITERTGAGFYDEQASSSKHALRGSTEDGSSTIELGSTKVSRPRLHGAIVGPR